MMMFDRNIKAWLRSTNARVLSCGKHTVFAVPERCCTDDLIRLLNDFDHTLTAGTILKDSPTTTAALADLSGGKVFLKRTNNKNWRFTLRYLFRPARAFRSAVAAEKLSQIGIPTPPVLAAGEYRNGLILKCGYLVTGSEPGITGMNVALNTADDLAGVMNVFLDQAAKIIALLHQNKVVHGDLKITNFYRNGNGEVGIWDLDSIRFYRKGIPMRKIENELTRLLASCVATFQFVGKEPPAIDQLVEQFCDRYELHCSFVPSRKIIAEKVRTKLQYWSTKK